MSVPEAAEVLGVSDDLVYDLVHSGQLPSARFGRMWRIPRRAIDLVVERALDGFDPNALLVRLGAAVGPSIGAVAVTDEGPSTTTGSSRKTPAPPVDPTAASQQEAAPAVALVR